MQHARSAQLRLVRGCDSACKIERKHSACPAAPLACRVSLHGLLPAVCLSVGGDCHFGIGSALSDILKQLLGCTMAEGRRKLLTTGLERVRTAGQGLVACTWQTYTASFWVIRRVAACTNRQRPCSPHLQPLSGCRSAGSAAGLARCPAGQSRWRLRGSSSSGVRRARLCRVAPAGACTSPGRCTLMSAQQSKAQAAADAMPAGCSSQHGSLPCRQLNPRHSAKQTHRTWSCRPSSWRRWYPTPGKSPQAGPGPGRWSPARQEVLPGLQCGTVKGCEHVKWRGKAWLLRRRAGKTWHATLDVSMQLGCQASTHLEWALPRYSLLMVWHGRALLHLAMELG